MIAWAMLQFDHYHNPANSQTCSQLTRSDGLKVILLGDSAVGKSK